MEGFVKAAEVEGIEGEVFQLGTGQTVSIGELFDASCAALGVKARAIQEQERLRPDNSEVMVLLSDPSKAKVGSRVGGPGLAGGGAAAHGGVAWEAHPPLRPGAVPCLKSPCRWICAPGAQGESVAAPDDSRQPEFGCSKVCRAPLLPAVPRCIGRVGPALSGHCPDD